MMKTSDASRKQPGKQGIQIFFRILIGLVLIIAGLAHLTFARTEFQAQVPNWIPMDKDLVVVISGIVEIVLGTLLLYLGKFRVTVGWIVAIFFLLIFPGNINQYINHVNGFGLNTDTSRFIRLLFQPVLILLVLWCTGALGALRKS